MIRLFHVYFPSRTLLLVLSEAMLIVLTLFMALVIRFRGDVGLIFTYEQGMLKTGIASAVLIVCMYYYDLYDSLLLHRFAEVFSRLVQVLGTASVILAGLYYVYPDIQLGRGPFIMWMILAGFALVGWRRLFCALNASVRLSDRTVLLGASPMALRLSSEIESRPELGMTVVGYVEASGTANVGVNGLSYLGEIDKLAAVMDRTRASRVILTMSDRRGRLPMEMLLNLKGRGIVVQDAADVYEAVTGRVSLESLRPGWLLFSDGFHVSRFTLLYKRCASIVLSTIAIIFTIPLMLLVALAVRLDSPGKAIFRQARVGRAGKIFTIYKFRSMRVNADEEGPPRPAAHGDDRITRVGYWLRKWRLDELPQLFNILRGDMYFIGPRPFTQNMEGELRGKIPFYSQRSIVKPGATGWAQIRRGYCETLEDNVEKLSYDLFYIKNLSIGLDCLILFDTLKILILGRGGR
jgi:sugar transferase (PEP-CTERM system associated)